MIKGHSGHIKKAHGAPLLWVAMKRPTSRYLFFSISTTSLQSSKHLSYPPKSNNKRIRIIIKKEINPSSRVANQKETRPWGGVKCCGYETWCKRFFLFLYVNNNPQSYIFFVHSAVRIIWVGNVLQMGEILFRATVLACKRYLLASAIRLKWGIYSTVLPLRLLSRCKCN